MKVLISVDIEGISGVVLSREAGYPIEPLNDPQSSADYLRACRWLTEDVNAAVKGAVAAGASEFVVHDSHGHDYGNVLLDHLHPDVEVVRGMPVTFFEYDDLLNSQYDACFLIGMHAKAGDSGVLSHVLDWPTITDVRLNGNSVGESEITALLAGYFDCPTVLITGDQIICEEIRKWTKGQIETAVVKTSFSRYAAKTLPLKKSHELIHDAAYQATERIKDFQPIRYEGPVSLEVEFLDRQIAKYVSWMPQIKYDGNRTVGYTDTDFFKVYKVLNAMLMLGHL